MNYEVLSDGLVQCPYVPTHRVRPGMRLQRHLLVCRQAQLKDKLSPFYANAVKMMICPGCNVHVHEDKMKRHQEKECKGVRNFESCEPNEDVPSWKMDMFADRKGNDNNNRNKEKSDDWDDEDWDNDNLTGGYDPSVKLAEMGAKLCLAPVAKSRAERREHRAQIRTGSDNPFLSDRRGYKLNDDENSNQSHKFDNDDWDKEIHLGTRDSDKNVKIDKECVEQKKLYEGDVKQKKNFSANGLQDDDDDGLEECKPSAERGFGRGHVRSARPQRPPGF